jgi:hypothetical protein
VELNDWREACGLVVTFKGESPSRDSRIIRGIIISRGCRKPNKQTVRQTGKKRNNSIEPSDEFSAIVKQAKTLFFSFSVFSEPYYNWQILSEFYCYGPRNKSQTMALVFQSPPWNIKTFLTTKDLHWVPLLFQFFGSPSSGIKIPHVLWHFAYRSHLNFH